MAYSPVENKYLSALTSLQFPDEQPAPEVAAAPEKPMAPGQRPGDILVAEVGSRGLPEQAYSGQKPAQMTAYDPTVRERLAGFLQAGFEGMGVDRYKARQNAQTLLGGPSSNLPLNLGLADVVPFLGTGLQTEEAVRMGGEAVTSAQQGNYGTAALQTAGAVLGLIPGVGGTVKAAKKLPKNLPVGLSTQAVGGMDNVLTPPAKAAAPVSDTGFYSAVEQAALNIPRKSGTGQAMLNDITKGENVKADEVKWIGLDDFLKGKKNVTREEVQEFVAANKVDIKEVTLGGKEPFNAQRLSELESEFKALKQHPIDDPSFGEDKYDEMIRLMNIRDQSTTDTLYEAADQAMRSAQRAQRQGNRITAEKYFREAELLNTRAEKLDLQGEGMSNPPKYSKYQLPGGENYREILLTTPTNMSGYNEYTKSLRAKYGDGGFANMPLTEVERARLDKFYANEETQPYKSSHWEQPNVLAHIRVNDRVDADGKKMLLVEEVQSDWHQAGRDKGYAMKPNPERVIEINQRLRELAKADMEASPEWDRLTQEKNLLTSGGGVPDAPMKDTWYQLALKRVLKYAADNGYERVGLTTGKTNAERFNLAETFDAMNYKKNKDGTFSLAVKPKGEGIFQSDFGGTTLSNIPEKDLPSIVGKELSQKIVAGEGRQAASRKVLEGIDLQVGGEGMKKYYDEIYPQFLAKYGKKWNAKVGETQIKVGADKVEPGIAAPGIGVEFPSKATPAPMEKVRFVDITPEMRKSVGKGQPLFTAAPAGIGLGSATMQDKEKN